MVGYFMVTDRAVSFPRRDDAKIEKNIQKETHAVDQVI